MISFWQAETWVTRLSLDSLIYFLFKFYRHLITEKHWYKPCRLPGIAYPFELKVGMSLTNVNENEEQL